MMKICFRQRMMGTYFSQQKHCWLREESSDVDLCFEKLFETYTAQPRRSNGRARGKTLGQHLLLQLKTQAPLSPQLPQFSGSNFSKRTVSLPQGKFSLSIHPSWQIFPSVTCGRTRNEQRTSAFATGGTSQLNAVRLSSPSLHHSFEMFLCHRNYLFLLLLFLGSVCRLLLLLFVVKIKFLLIYLMSWCSFRVSLKKNNKEVG